MSDFLLLETGDALLLETGDHLLLDVPFTTLGQAQMGGGVMRAGRLVQYLAVAAPLFTGAVQLPDVEFPAYVPTRTFPVAQQQAFATDPRLFVAFPAAEFPRGGYPDRVPAALRSADFPAWASSYEFPAPVVPDFVAPTQTAWLPRLWSPSLVGSEFVAPVFPVPDHGRRQRIVGITFPILEQSSGNYLAVLQDDRGRIISGSALTGLRLTLYVIRHDNALIIVNNRHDQDVLNTNNVTVYNDLQFTSTGKPYNLRWHIQPGDTTMVDAALSHERHIGQLEWRWAGGRGVLELTMIVHNLRTVH